MKANHHELGSCMNGHLGAVGEECPICTTLMRTPSWLWWGLAFLSGSLLVSYVNRRK
jgi:hypothetical protein